MCFCAVKLICECVDCAYDWYENCVFWFLICLCSIHTRPTFVKTHFFSKIETIFSNICEIMLLCLPPSNSLLDVCFFLAISLNVVQNSSSFVRRRHTQGGHVVHFVTWMIKTSFFESSLPSPYVFSLMIERRPCFQKFSNWIAIPSVHQKTFLNVFGDSETSQRTIKLHPTGKRC